MPAGGFHMTATVQHQVYGGVAAEHPVVDAAIAATTGLVLRYNGAVVDGPYSSSCGGRTALPSDAWAGGHDHGYLQSVSDIDPATGHAFCDLSPRNAWTVSFSEPLLRQAVVRHLGARGASGSTAPTVSAVSVGRRSVSGRVATLVIQTDRGTVTLNGRDVRSAFRMRVARSCPVRILRWTAKRGPADGCPGSSCEGSATGTGWECASGERSVAPARDMMCARSCGTTIRVPSSASRTERAAIVDRRVTTPPEAA